MDSLALERAKQRISDAAAGRPEPAALEAALERSRFQIEALAVTAAELEASIPAQVGSSVRDSLRTEVLPVARHIAEIRGLLNQAIRRLERLEGALLAERHARVDDLALLVDLVSTLPTTPDLGAANTPQQQRLSTRRRTYGGSC